MHFLKRTHGELHQYKKIFMGYFSMIISPFLLAIVLFIISRILTLNSIDNFGTVKARYFESQVTSLFREVEIITATIASDSAISRQLNQKELTEADEINLCISLRNYAELSAFISNIYVICTEQDYILSSIGLYTSESINEILAKIGETPQSFVEVTSNQFSSDWHIGSKGVVEPYYIMPIYNTETSQKVGDIIIVLYTSVLYNILSEENVAFCCLFDDSRYISTIGSGLSNINWYSDDEISNLLGINVKCFLKSTDSFTYMVAIPTASFYAPSRIIIFCFISFFVIITFIGAFQAIRTSRRDFNVISSIIAKLPGTLKNNPTYDNLTLEVEQALIRYRDNIDRLNIEVKSNTLQWVLEGGPAKPLSAEILNDAGISTDSTGYHVATLFVYDYSDMFFDRRSEVENRDIALVIFHSVLTTVAGTRAIIACCRVGVNIAVVFCHNVEDTTDRIVTAIIQDAVELIEQNYGLNIRVALSGWIELSSELSEAYHQTQEISHFARSVNIDTGFISHRGLIKDGEFITGTSYIKQIQIIVNTLLLGKYEIIPQMVETLLKKEVASLRGNYTLIKSRITCIAELLSEAVIICEERGIEKSAIAEKLRIADSISNLIETTTEVFSELSRIAAASQTANAVDRACEYIRDNISNPNMSVLNICEVVSVSVQHLSRLFRKQLNKTITEYINEYRINYAKELLYDKKLTVSKIAQTVGYGSNDAFYRNFKKIVGITPTEYAKLMLSNGKS